MSHELTMIIADVMPEEMLMDFLSEAVTNYKINPTEENKNKLSMHCMLFLSKGITNEFGAEKIIKEIKEVEQIRDRLNSQNQ